MKEIVTVTGIIQKEDLGYCQCHEHVALSKGRSFEINPALRIDDMTKSSEELKRYRSAGGCSLIDAQPVGCGRISEGLHYLSVCSGVNIIASTGFHKLIYYPGSHWIHNIREEDLTSLYVRELTEGMALNGENSYPSEFNSFKAGIIKTALDSEGLTPKYKNLFRAAAKASIAANRILMVHTEQRTDPRDLQRFLLSLGVDAQNIMFCHMDRACAEISIHKEILANGSYLEFDTIGRPKYHSDEYEANLFFKLIEAGYEEQLLYSLDTTRLRLKSYTPDAVGLDYILTVFNNTLKKFGVTEKTLQNISMKNPARMLTQ